MATERPVTPEKQLLRLIEEPQSGKGAALQGRTIKKHGLNLFSLKDWASRFSFFREKAKKGLKKSKSYHINIRVVNTYLAFFVAAMAFYFISHLSFSVANSKKIPDFSFDISKEVKPAIFQQPSILKTAPFYSEKMRERNIFDISPADKNAETAMLSSARLEEETQHLKLVGISWSNDPDAMIEDTRALRTFLVKRGQMIGDFKVQAIFKDKIILSYGGEEVELK